jgi:DDE superfamily endonuclease/Helix-turn-helix of DDE superfamily endonuclease
MKDGLLSGRIELPYTVLTKAGRRMYYTTGFPRAEISDLCEMALRAASESGKAGWPPCLGLYKSVVVTLSYMRRNRVQAELAESYGISQPTVSRAISAIMPLLEKGLAGVAPTADDIGPKCQLIVDGTLLPCWSWASEPGLYSGKHKTTGMNVQVACTLDGEIAWISDPVAGSRHDMYCIGESGILSEVAAQAWIADKGYIGSGMITPVRKPAYRDLLDWEKEFNRAVNRIRYVVERAIANFKTWRIVHTDYRRPLATFAQTISVVIGLHFLRNEL